MNTKELKEYLEEQEYYNTAIYENPSYETAVASISEEGAVIYDYDKMIDYLVRYYCMTEEEAVGHINYDTLNSNVPNGMIKPVVMFKIIH